MFNHLHRCFQMCPQGVLKSQDGNHERAIEALYLFFNLCCACNNVKRRQGFNSIVEVITFTS